MIYNSTRILLQHKKQVLFNVIFNPCKRCLSKASGLTKLQSKDPLEKQLESYEDNIYYSDFMEKRRLKFGYKKNQAIMDMQRKLTNANLEVIRTIQPLPLALKLLNKDDNVSSDTNNTNEQVIQVNKRDETQLPYAEVENTKIDDSYNKEVDTSYELLDSADLSEIEVRQRLKDVKNSHISKWMEDYDSFDQESVQDSKSWNINYGTPDPNAKISHVPCGGCGALLHCKDTAIPGT